MEKEISNIQKNLCNVKKKNHNTMNSIAKSINTLSRPGSSHNKLNKSNLANKMKLQKRQKTDEITFPKDTKGELAKNNIPKPKVNSDDTNSITFQHGSNAGKPTTRGKNNFDKQSEPFKKDKEKANKNVSSPSNNSVKTGQNSDQHRKLLSLNGLQEGDLLPNFNSSQNIFSPSENNPKSSFAIYDSINTSLIKDKYTYYFNKKGNKKPAKRNLELNYTPNSYANNEGSSCANDKTESENKPEKPNPLSHVLSDNNINANSNNCATIPTNRTSSKNNSIYRHYSKSSKQNYTITNSSVTPLRQADKEDNSSGYKYKNQGSKKDNQSESYENGPKDTNNISYNEENNSHQKNKVFEKRVLTKYNSTLNTYEDYKTHNKFHSEKDLDFHRFNDKSKYNNQTSKNIPSYDAYKNRLIQKYNYYGYNQPDKDKYDSNPYSFRNKNDIIITSEPITVRQNPKNRTPKNIYTNTERDSAKFIQDIQINSLNHKLNANLSPNYSTTNLNYKKLENKIFHLNENLDDYPKSGGTSLNREINKLLSVNYKQWENKNNMNDNEILSYLRSIIEENIRLKEFENKVFEMVSFNLKRNKEEIDENDYFSWVNNIQSENTKYRIFCEGLMNQYNLKTFDELNNFVHDTFLLCNQNDKFVSGLKNILCEEFTRNRQGNKPSYMENSQTSNIPKKDDYDNRGFNINNESSKRISNILASLERSSEVPYKRKKKD